MHVLFVAVQYFRKICCPAKCL